MISFFTEIVSGGKRQVKNNPSGLGVGGGKQFPSEISFSDSLKDALWKCLGASGWGVGQATYKALGWALCRGWGQWRRWGGTKALLGSS